VPWPFRRPPGVRSSRGLSGRASRAEFLEAIRSGKYRYKSMTFDDRRVRLHGDSTAIVSGTCRVQVTTGGRDLDVKLRFTELYLKQGGAWKMALWQSTRVPDPAP